MKLTIPIEKSFDCPEGIFSGTFVEHRLTSKATQTSQQNFARLVFQVEEQSTDDKLVLVAKNFVPSLKKGSNLRQMLDFWLGEEFVEAHKQDNQLDFDPLNGRKADLVVKHIVNKEYLKPYVQLESVYPANSITLHSREAI
jgi:hypothetical protein